MLPFHVALKSGVPIYEQVVQAVKRAIARGDLKPGAPLPSVRELSRELQINPNTAQKVITALVNERLVEVIPGIGSIVSDRSRLSGETAGLILNDTLETTVLEAITYGVTEEQFIESVRRHWNEITKGSKS